MPLTGGTEPTIALDLRQSTADPVVVDIGNKGTQGRTVTSTIQLALFTHNENAVWGGRQALQKMSYPFANVSFSANRAVFRLEVGDCFLFSYAPYGISNMVCRVMQIEEEGLDSENIIVHAMEDVFSLANTITEYSTPSSHSTTTTTYAVYPLTLIRDDD